MPNECNYPYLDVKFKALFHKQKIAVVRAQPNAVPLLLPLWPKQSVNLYPKETMRSIAARQARAQSPRNTCK